jgi:hypothetical protein
VVSRIRRVSASPLITAACWTLSIRHAPAPRGDLTTLPRATRAPCSAGVKGARRRHNDSYAGALCEDPTLTTLAPPIILGETGAGDAEAQRRGRRDAAVPRRRRRPGDGRSDASAEPGRLPPFAAAPCLLLSGGAPTLAMSSFGDLDSLEEKIDAALKSLASPAKSPRKVRALTCTWLPSPPAPFPFPSRCRPPPRPRAPFPLSPSRRSVHLPTHPAGLLVCSH